MRIQKDVEELLATIRLTMSDGIELVPGYEIKMDCVDTLLIAESDVGEIRGCGKELALFIVSDDTESTWDMMAELFLWHLVGIHEMDNLI